MQLVSDNGDDIYYGDGIAAKDLAANEFKKFRSDIVTISAAPVAAMVTVGGRVATAAGYGIAGAQVVLINSATGARHFARTSAFGYFNFEEVEVGTTYVVEVSAKRYSFESQVISVNESIEDLIFTPQ